MMNTVISSTVTLTEGSEELARTRNDSLISMILSGSISMVMHISELESALNVNNACSTVT